MIQPIAVVNIHSVKPQPYDITICALQMQKCIFEERCFHTPCVLCLVIWVWIFWRVPTKRNIAVQTCTPGVAAPLLCFGSMGMDFSACFNQTEHCCSNLHTRCSPHLYCVLVIWVWIFRCVSTKRNIAVQTCTPGVVRTSTVFW